MKRFFLAAFSMLLFLTTPAFAGDKVIKVLAIGNSFSEDSIEQNLWQIAHDQGVDMVIGNMYIGGCSVDRHFKNITEDIADYRYCKITVDGKREWFKQSHLKDVIKDELWDYVSIQQVSQEAGQPQSYTHLQEVVDWIRTNAPQAEVVFHQTWAYGPESKHGGFAKYDRDQMKMYRAVVSVTKEQSEKVGIKKIIPTGTALQDARTTRLGNDLTRDGFHMSKGFGRYLAACTWFETLTGVNVMGNAYVPDGTEKGTEAITAEDAAIARKAAHQAVAVPFNIVPLDSASCILLPAENGKNKVLAVNNSEEEVRVKVVVTDSVNGRKVFCRGFRLASGSIKVIGKLKAADSYNLKYTLVE